MNKSKIIKKIKPLLIPKAVHVTENAFEENLLISWLDVGIAGHNFGRGPSKDHSTTVWFKLAQWLQRS
jgi:hypothetical protein